MLSKHNYLRRVFTSQLNIELFKAVLLFSFIFPLFFQLTGQIFHSTVFPFDPKGNVLLTPIPIAVPVCFIAIVLFYRFEDRHFGMGFVFTVFMALLLSLTVSTNGETKAEFAKFLLLIQVIIPLFAFILGKLYQPAQSDYLKIEAIIFYVLLIVLPLQLISTMMWGRAYLSPDLFFFSLYQVIQYLPVIFISLYFFAAVGLHHNKYFRYLTVALAPLIGIIGIASISLSSGLIIFFGTLLFMLSITGHFKFKVLTYFAYAPNVSKHFAVKLHVKNVGEITEQSSQPPIPKQLAKKNIKNSDIQLPANLKDRVEIWSFYLKGISTSPKTFIFGNSNRPDRKTYPSAHNYYLDIVYNFGFIPLLPFLFLIGLTINHTARLALTGRLPRELIMLGGIIAYFIFVENFFKVVFRQPYPGIIMFFLWGVFMERLQYLQKTT